MASYAIIINMDEDEESYLYFCSACVDYVSDCGHRINHQGHISAYGAIDENWIFTPNTLLLTTGRTQAKFYGTLDHYQIRETETDDSTD